MATPPQGFTPQRIDSGATPTFAGVVAATAGPAAAQQHTLPAVASDTMALLAATQTLTNKTLTAPVETLAINAQTASYTLVLADASKLVTMSVAGANNLTVPANANVAFAIGSQVMVAQIGAGQTTVVAAAGVTVSAGGAKLKLTQQYSRAVLTKTATNTWLLSGELSA